MITKSIPASVTWLYLYVFGSIMMSIVAGCESEHDQQENAVIAWASKMDLTTGNADLNKYPNKLDAWIAEGHALPNVESIIQRLLRNNDKRIKPVILVNALEYVGTADSVPLLIEQLKNDWEVMREHAIWALGKIRDTRAVSHLAYCLFYDQSQNNRMSAAQALLNIGDSICVETLERRIEELQREKEFVEQCLADLRRKLDQADAGQPVSTSRPGEISSRPASGD